MRTVTATLACGLLLAACGGTTVQIPPRLGLSPYPAVGLVTFTSENAKGALAGLATDRFRDQVFAAQSGVEILELGAQDALLSRVGRDRLDPEAVRSIGTQEGVGALFVGHLVVSDVKPRATIGPVAGVSADVSVTLTVRLLSGESGGTLWSSSAQATETIAGLSVAGGTAVFGAQDPNDAYGKLVDRLVEAVTTDLRPTYERR
jgi:hypothetical protein